MARGRDPGFRVIASLTDRFTAPIKNINRGIGEATAKMRALAAAPAAIARSAGLDKIGAAAANVGRSFGNLRNAVASTISPFARLATIGAGVGIVSLTASSIGLGGELVKLNRQTGWSIESLQRYGYAAEQSGVDTTRTKLIAFMIGAVYAGLAGCLYASSIRFISPDSFSGTQAILLMTMLIVGGMGSIAGCVIGAVALTILPEALRFLGQWYLVLYGLGVIAVIVLAPGGLASLVSRLALRRAGAR